MPDRTQGVSQDYGSESRKSPWRVIFQISLGVFGVQMEGMLGDLVVIWGVCEQVWRVLRLKTGV